MACSKRSRTREAPTPTYISTKSEPEMEKKGTPASPATALASSVLPVPGGPISSTPLGMRAPRELNFSGLFRNSTISFSSSFSSSAPATSSKVMRLPSVGSFALAFAKAMGLPVPRVWRIIIHHRATIAMMGSSTGSQTLRKVESLTGTYTMVTGLSGWAALYSRTWLWTSRINRSVLGTW